MNFQCTDIQFFAHPQKYKDKKNKIYIPLDMSKSIEIYDFFYHKEQWIQICKRMKYSQVFKGGVSLTWGGGIFQSKETEDPIKQRELIELLQEALDYRDMFGLCPIKIIRDRKTGIKKPIIPEFGSGSFISIFNIKTLKTEDIVFAPNGNLINNKQEIDPSIKVFVWPGKKPSTHNKQFKSDIFTVFEEYLIIEELKKNLLDADYNSSHPTIFTQSRPDSKDLSQLTEEEVFGDADDPMLNPSEKHTYRRDLFRAKRLERMSESINYQTKSSCDSSLTKRVDSTNNNRIIAFKRKRMWEENIESLPEGEEMANIVIPQSNKNIIEFMNRYEEQVCLLIGIPKGFIAGRGKFKTDAEQETEIMRNTIIKDREDANLFYQFVYELMHRGTDDKKIVQVLMNVNNIKKQQQPDPAEMEQLRQTKNNIKKIGDMPNRIEILFNEDPFSRTINLNNVQFASDRDAITAEEEVNSIRSSLGLEKVPVNDDLVNMRKLQKDIKRQELKMQLENLKLQLKETKNRIQHEDENNKLEKQQQQQQGSIKNLNNNSSNNMLSKKQKIQE